MKYFRAISTGAFVWLLIFTAFAILGFIPLLKDSLNLQALVVGILIVPFAILGTTIYYKNGSRASGMTVGIIMALTALLLDALITVPFVEIPKGGSYLNFFSFPLLWMLVFINIATVYFFWKYFIKNSQVHNI